MCRGKWILAILVFVIFGCASIQTGNKMTLFDDTARAYLRAIRWGEYETAYAFRKLETANDEVPDFESLRQIRVTAFKVKQTIVSEDKLSILRVVDFQYYRTTKALVRNLIDNQKWEYDEEANRWHLTSGLPDFK